MNPDQIREVTLQKFPELEARERRNPNGWSFWVGETRIFRALSKRGGAEVKWTSTDEKYSWEGNDEELLRRILVEIHRVDRNTSRRARGIPDGITPEKITSAIAALDSGAEHLFSDSTGFDVLFEGKRYPPKAVIGIASELVSEGIYGPYDFTGGLKSKCFRVLEDNGFEIVTKGDTKPFPEELDENETIAEGSVKKVLVNRYERDPKARAKCIEEYGASCQVCDIKFGEVYGEIGAEFIHVHHIKQLSDVGENYVVDPKNDLVPVCPNCHAMLHKRRPPYTTGELRELMSRGRLT